jgi:chaperonin GroEL (HSP60 family)
MIGTCTRAVTTAEFELIEKSFPVLLQEVCDHGRITEETFDRLGFPQDINMFGEEAPREAEITNKPCQRGKILSSEAVRELRVDAVKDAKKADEEQKIIDHHTRAEECSLLVLKGMAIPDPVLANAKVEHFAKEKVDQLKSFILVRTSGDTALGGGQLHSCENEW